MDCCINLLLGWCQLGGCIRDERRWKFDLSGYFSGGHRFWPLATTWWSTLGRRAGVSANLMPNTMFSGIINWRIQHFCKRNGGVSSLMLLLYIIKLWNAIVSCDQQYFRMPTSWNPFVPKNHCPGPTANPWRSSCNFTSRSSVHWPRNLWPCCHMSWTKCAFNEDTSPTWMANVYE